MTIRIVINGFGRIGRTVLRQLLGPNGPDDIEVVRINDIAPAETCAYLFAYDSVFGVWPETVAARDDLLHVGDRAIPLSDAPDLSTQDLSGVDLVMECTGHAKDAEFARRGLAAGARAVLISGPSDGADVTVVMGANDDDLGAAQVVSNASCTTNALAPLVRHLDAALGLEAAHMTTVHCYTASQPMTDAPRGPLARSRAGALSMVPTTTSAADQVLKVLPAFAGRLTSAAVRVPTASVSAIDLTGMVRTPTDAEALNALVAGFDPHLIGVTDQPLVSSDLRGRPESFILAAPETMMQGPQHFRLFGWYDNEWGFSARMIDMARRMAAR